jgi:hypothetical protein
MLTRCSRGFTSFSSGGGQDDLCHGMPNLDVCAQVVHTHAASETAPNKRGASTPCVDEEQKEDDGSCGFEDSVNTGVKRCVADT